MLLRRLARPLLAASFVADGVDTLMHPESRAKAASALVQQGEQRLPDNLAAKLPSDTAMVVRVNAIAQVSGGVLLALGKMPRLASVVLAATVIPATVTEQDFWAEQDPGRKAAKRNAFLKDMGLLGGLMIAAADTAGKPSLGWRGRRAAHSAAAAVSATLPFGAADSATGEALRQHAYEAADRARTLSGIAAVKGSEVAEVAQQHGSEWADVAKERGAELAEVAKEHGADWAEIAKEHGSEWAEIAKHRAAILADMARRRGVELAEVAKERAPELAETARRRGSDWAEVAKERAPELAETARRRGSDWAEIAKERGPELAANARERGVHIAEAARDRVEARRG
ncbi:DoxX family membrane protein [Nocardia sp. GCM10030253]|uniref:DoxX family membrane protein n=1 Tax=Nocardia sp. GCM10030253 TaxID=3273404 RepID=UPI00363FC627